MFASLVIDRNFSEVYHRAWVASKATASWYAQTRCLMIDTHCAKQTRASTDHEAANTNGGSVGKDRISNHLNAEPSALR
jgi:hypothetical protein